MSKGTLRDRARAILQDGRVPARRPDGIWGGRASGQDRCLVCEQLVPRDQIVWEAEYDGADGTARHFFHVLCFRALEHELPSPEDASDGGGEGERRSG